jgi:ArsR family transcriptional regulator
MAVTFNFNPNELEKAAFILKTIAHPTRLAIIDLLSKMGRQPVSAICKQLGLEQSLASHHLSVMKLKGVLSSERDGKNVFYTLKLKEVTQVMQCIEHCDLSRF